MPAWLQSCTIVLMNKILDVSNLSKRFGNFTAVDDISFSLNEGEILGFLGPNGAGKTTTIQMLLGALKPTSGNVAYFGKNLLTNRQDILEKINFSSTYTDLPWLLTVNECLIFLSYLYKIENRKERIEKLIKTFRLEALVKKQVLGLSAGQLTRVKLAKSFINFPKVLLLDEPTASLDPDVAQYIRDFLIKERKEFNVSIIITSHNMSEVEEICDRVIFINNGKLIADETPDKLAKTIKICHIELFVRTGLDKLIAYAKSKKLKLKSEGRRVIVDVEEKNIPEFLKDLNRSRIDYNEISIDKPSLEDYFLEVSKKRKR